MKKITASRISDGNKIFPASITIEDVGLKVRIPGFWKDEETFVSYTDISGVEVSTPLVGFSTIEFNVMGSRAKAHGFTKSEVNEIKKAIDEGKSKPATQHQAGPGFSMPTGANAPSENPVTVNKQPGLGHFLGKTMNESFNTLLSQQERFDQQDRDKANKIENLASLRISNDTNEILDQLNYLSSLASSKPDKDVKNVLIEKMEFGIMKLRGAGLSNEASFFEKKLEPLKKKGWF